MDSWHILYQTVSSDSFTEIKREISQKLVLCNEAMIQGLYKSGVVEPLETIKSKALTNTSVTVSFAELTPEKKLLSFSMLKSSLSCAS